MDRKKSPGVDVTERDLEPVESPSNSLVPLDTDPRIAWNPTPSEERLRPVDTADASDDEPAPPPTSTTQLLDDDVVDEPTLDKLPRVALKKKPAGEAPPPHAPEAKKPAPVLEASSAPVARKSPRKKVVGEEDQFEAVLSEPSLEALPATKQASQLRLGRVRFDLFDVVLGLSGLLAVAVLAWLFW